MIKWVSYKHRSLQQVVPIHTESIINKRQKVLSANQRFFVHFPTQIAMHEIERLLCPSTAWRKLGTMVINANLPHRFWAEAFFTVTYLRNRSPTEAVGGMTPHEAWTGEKPRIDGLWVFGCQAFVHIPKDERKKLESKSRKCVLIGYGTTLDYMIHWRERCSTAEMSFSMNRSVVSRSPLRSWHNQLCTSNIQMSLLRQFSHPHLQ